MFAIYNENLKKLKYDIFLRSFYGHEYEKIFKEEEPIEILKILGLINNIEEHNRIYNHVQKKKT